ncbi:hypothetical protein [Amycolatopsis keratiniphila]|nr:hypothetical protein [Amycolatopsis keratiniphila]
MDIGHRSVGLRCTFRLWRWRNGTGLTRYALDKQFSVIDLDAAYD